MSEGSCWRLSVWHLTPESSEELLENLHPACAADFKQHGPVGQIRGGYSQPYAFLSWGRRWGCPWGSAQGCRWALCESIVRAGGAAWAEQAHWEGSLGAGLQQLRAPARQPGHKATPAWHCCSHVCSRPGLWAQGPLDHALLHVQTCPGSAKGRQPRLPPAPPLQWSFPASLGSWVLWDTRTGKQPWVAVFRHTTAPSETPPERTALCTITRLLSKAAYYKYHYNNTNQQHNLITPWCTFNQDYLILHLCARFPLLSCKRLIDIYFYAVLQQIGWLCFAFLYHVPPLQVLQMWSDNSCTSAASFGHKQEKTEVWKDAHTMAKCQSSVAKSGGKGMLSVCQQYSQWCSWLDCCTRWNIVLGTSVHEV